MARVHGDEVMQPFLDGKAEGLRPFAPPFLVSGRQVIAQVAAILDHLGPELGLVPEAASRRVQALQLQLTIADLVAEVHDTHHPIAASQYYEDQKREAKARAASMRGERLPKFLGWFESVLEANGGLHPLREHSYVDLSLFQLLSGLDYMFPRRMQALRPSLPLLHALKDRVERRPNIAAYLASERRLAFNTNGIFRHYPELDADA